MTTPTKPPPRPAPSTLALLLKSDFGRLDPKRARELAGMTPQVNPPKEPEK